MDSNLENMKRRKGAKGLPPEKKPRRMSDRIKNKLTSSQASDMDMDMDIDISVDVIGLPPIVMNAGSTDFPPEDRAFGIDLLLSKIIRCMSVKQLKTCRLVCRRWNFFALEALSTRKSLQLCGSFTEDSGFRYALIVAQEKVEKRLEDLIEVMRTSDGFPCRHFCFQDGSLNYPSLQKFLNDHGGHIKRLCLNVHSSYAPEFIKIPTLATLKKLLTSQAPNLERLRLDKFPQKWKISGDKNKFLQKSTSTSATANDKEKSITNFASVLPNLKLLELPEDTTQGIFNEFVETAVNLKQLDLINGKVDFFIEAKKLYLLKNLFFAPSAETLPSYEMIVHEKLQLTKLQFFMSYRGIETRQDLWTRTIKVLYNLLESNCETLTTIKWKPVGFLQDLKIPVLPKLTKIKIEEGLIPPAFHSRNNRIFPRGLSLSKVFPNLTTVVIDISPREEQCTSDYFDSNYDPIPTVKYIYIDEAHKYSPAFMNILFPQIFPNAIYGKFDRLGTVSPGTQGIWKFLQLEQLELSFNVGIIYYDTEHRPYSMDSFFTGITAENCLKLNKSKILNTSDRQLRVNPSIVNLKSLKRLKIGFYDQNEFVRPDNEYYSLQLSNLTGRYGLELCPRLEVSVSVDAYRLENVYNLKHYVIPLRPFVQCGKSIQCLMIYEQVTLPRSERK